MAAVPRLLLPCAHPLRPPHPLLPLHRLAACPQMVSAARQTTIIPVRDLALATAARSMDIVALPPITAELDVCQRSVSATLRRQRRRPRRRQVQPLLPPRLAACHRMASAVPQTMATLARDLPLVAAVPSMDIAVLHPTFAERDASQHSAPAARFPQVNHPRPAV